MLSCIIYIFVVVVDHLHISKGGQGVSIWGSIVVDRVQRCRKKGARGQLLFFKGSEGGQDMPCSML